MKKSKYILLSFLVGSGIFSCTKDDFGPTAHLNSAAQILSPIPGASLVLKESEQNDLLPPFTWSAADFGFAAAVTYKLEIDQVGNGFSDPTTLASVNKLSFSMTQGDLNSFLLGRGLEGETETAMELRVIASISSDVAPLISGSLPLTVTPFTTTIVYDQLQVPGSYQGWDPGNNNTIIYSGKNDGKYEGYLYFQDADTKFKYTRGPSWDTNWGDNGPDGSLDPGGTDIAAGAAGLYHLQVNLLALTHTYALTNWGLIGSATPDGWNSDQDMTYDPVSGKVSITLNLVAGEIKFRANDNWDFNYGDDGNNKTLDVNGTNIVIAEAGNYTIDLLIVRQPKLKYQITKN